MNNNIEKSFTLGGSVEKALSGNYELSPVAVFQEAWKFTIRNFLSFSPSILTLLMVQGAIFYIALKLQVGDPAALLEMFLHPETLDPAIFQAIFVANFSYEVISAPIYAGVSLMAMSHAAGLKTSPRHILKGLQFTVPLILATLVALTLQGIAGTIVPVLSMYLGLAFSNSVLLICEKRVPPMQSLLLSLRAINKKLFPIIAIYMLLMLLFIASVVFYGIFLVVVLPLFFHVKGIIYRNMFGISLKIIATDNSDDTTPPDSTQTPDNNTEKPTGSDTFDA
ncbi:hypothetical protein L3Q72_07330 [Vibrio sp. JC009]|uniref:hypothetical protein n=1 Tax=Vibrio sp. JC009 TaxID=2912314 RepID=UPI0023B1676C|nr:hypothetical protein [Vibrio sp. JC009]WED23197.1 hypothetical protein L3Q72_07330 [Vibrio sp. JC009]